MPGLTGTLKGQGPLGPSHSSTINAMTARVPVAALKVLTQLPYVESISIDAIVKAEDYSWDSTLRGTLGLPLYTAGGDGVGVAWSTLVLEPGPEFDDRIAAFYDFTEGGRVHRRATIMGTALTWPG